MQPFLVTNIHERNCKQIIKMIFQTFGNMFGLVYVMVWCRHLYHNVSKALLKYITIYVHTWIILSVISIRDVFNIKANIQTNVNIQWNFTVFYDSMHYWMGRTELTFALAWYISLHKLCQTVRQIQQNWFSLLKIGINPVQN